MSSLLLLSTADTDLLALKRAEPEGYGAVEALNPVRVAAADVERLVAGVRDAAYWGVGLRLLGGRRAFVEGFDELRSACVEAGLPFLAWPGERGQDLELESASTAPRALLAETGRYWDEGGVENLRNLLLALSDSLRGTGYGAAPPAEVPRNGVYRRASADSGRPVIGVAFYRAHWMSGNLDFVDDLCRAIEDAGGEPHAFFCYSLRDEGPGGMPAAVAECLLEGDRVLVDCLLLALGLDLCVGLRLLQIAFALQVLLSDERSDGRLGFADDLAERAARGALCGFRHSVTAPSW